MKAALQVWQLRIFLVQAAGTFFKFFLIHVITHTHDGSTHQHVITHEHDHSTEYF